MMQRNYKNTLLLLIILSAVATLLVMAKYLLPRL